ncbi:metallophosphoesterase [Verrucomicrobia bacterium LW23]|nr:metallophosphoesterase [Verrucomicrobia bacterium LW23]
MRFGIFADVHSNLEALEAVLEDMQAQGVTNTVCLGDIVGYNASPRECLEIVRALGCPIVKGNHDEEASEQREVEHFNDLALASIKYSRSQLTKEHKEFIRALPLTRPVNSFTIVHSTLDQPGRWGYVFSCLDAEASFQYQKTNLCFFGHTHVPHVFIRDTRVHEFFYKKIDLQPDKKYFVNVGSVGQPRDNDWRSAYVIYDSSSNNIELRRVPYDIAKAQIKIKNAGLPMRLAERLANAV